MRGADLMPAFWRAYDATLTHHDRARALQDLFFEPHQAIYTQAGLTPDLELIAAWLAHIDKMASQVRTCSVTAQTAFHTQLAGFCSRLPDCEAERLCVYFMPSLFQFDGHLRTCDNELPLFIGIDGILYHHGAHVDMDVLMSHEIYHLYHGQVNPDVMLPTPRLLAVQAWIEGAATLASQQLNPHASRQHVLFDDARLIDIAPETMAGLAADLLACQASIDDADHERYFSIGYRGSVPPRCGYLLGLGAADMASRTLTLAQMARLNSSEILRHMQNYLQKIVPRAIF